jgi:hypothetical protein
MWIILVISSGISCTYFSVKSILDYFNHDFVTVIKTINEQQVDFPAITICNYESNKLEFTILDYMSNRNKHSSNIKISTSIKSYSDLDYGLCYRINNRKNENSQFKAVYTVNSGGMFYGLNLDLYIPTDDDFGQLKVYIHNQTHTPLSLFNKGYILSTGCYNYFQVQRIFEDRLEEPYNDCLDDLESFKFNKTLIHHIRSQGQVYARDDCIRLCTNLHYIQMNPCNCSLDSLDDILYIKCSYNLKKANLNVSKCTDNFIEAFQSSDPFEKCSKYCPLECDSNKLLVSLNTRELPRTGNITKGFDYTEFKTYENVSKSFFSIYVYYEDLDYTLIEQIPKIQIFDLISNVGGLFGLFLGNYIFLD